MKRPAKYRVRYAQVGGGCCVQDRAARIVICEASTASLARRIAIALNAQQKGK